MKNFTIVKLRTNPDDMAMKVRRILSEKYGIEFKHFDETSVCGKVTVVSNYSYGYMKDPKWTGRVTITSNISLKATDFK